jgi:hypothetical protein
MKILKLTQNKVTQIDNDTYKWAKNHKWFAWKNGNTFYAGHAIGGKGNQQNVFLHHCVIGRPLNGFIIDHIDGNGLNNCKTNLRIVSASINQRNSYKHRKGLLFGAHRLPNGRWQARATIYGKTIGFGTFATQEEANRVAVESSDVV